MPVGFVALFSELRQAREFHRDLRKKYKRYGLLEKSESFHKARAHLDIARAIFKKFDKIVANSERENTALYRIGQPQVSSNISKAAHYTYKAENER